MKEKQVSRGPVPIWSAIVLWLICLLSADSFALCQDAELKVEPGSGVVATEQAEADSESTALGESSTETAEVELTESESLRIRLIGFAFFGGFVLAFLALLFGYLRLDHATRGFHSGRLQLAAIALTVIVLIVGYLLWTQVLFK